MKDRWSDRYIFLCVITQKLKCQKFTDTGVIEKLLFFLSSLLSFWGRCVIVPSSRIRGCILCHFAPQKLHSNILRVSVISSVSSSHSGHVRVGPMKISLKSEFFSVGIVSPVGRWRPYYG